MDTRWGVAIQSTWSLHMQRVDTILRRLTLTPNDLDLCQRGHVPSFEGSSRALRATQRAFELLAGNAQLD